MCGIAGEISWNGDAASDAVERITAALAHRGPDDNGLWRSTDGRCVLGHRRLSIIDLSSAGHQPMRDPITGNVIVFNGEIYNFQDIRRELERDGERFRSDSDTEVILALYRLRGRTCLARLRGMFAFAIWDEARGELFLARDRVGKKPLAYAPTRNGLAFASEIDALARHPKVDRELDVEALDLYLQLQYVPAPWTIYRGIRKLPAGHFAVVRPGGMTMEPYWQVDYRTKRAVIESEALDLFEEKLSEAVRLRMIADVPIGALLSGGVDSSVVVALMARQSREPIRTFSIGFEEAAFNEVEYANIVARRYETAHHPEILRPDVQGIMRTLVRHYGEPYADPSAVPSFQVARAARKHVKVALNGDGGDELLGGYPRYTLSDTAIRLAPMLGRSASGNGLEKLLDGLPAARTVPQKIRRRWLIRYAHPELQSMLNYEAMWNDPERSRLLPDAPNGARSVVGRWREEWLTRAIASADNPIDRMLWLDSQTYLAGNLLVKMDIASMHCGLEARSPLLDQEVIEFAAGLPVHLKVHRGTGKYLLKKLGERYLPRELMYRRKMGFGIPTGDWLIGPLRSALDDIVLDPEVMAPLDGTEIRRTMREFTAGKGDHGWRMWVLLMYGLWRQECG